MTRYFLPLILFISTLYSDEFLPSLTIKVPMRDGVELPTDLYFPSEEPSKQPCILIRSPCGRKEAFVKYYATMVKEGFVVAIQETRSALDKEGRSIPYWSDGWKYEKDGYDAVEWLAASPYTNGKIGTAGMSALGITQVMMAPSAPPSLKCQHIGVAAASLYHHATFPGGQLLKNQIEGWLGKYAWDSGVASWISSQPVYNDFWESFNTLKVANLVQVPAVHYGGWYDIFLQGTIDAFVTRQNQGGKGAKGEQKLLIGPWTHFWPRVTTLGDYNVPKEGYVPPVDLSLSRWFNLHLKEDGKGAVKIPAVTYYVMGPLDGTVSSGNVWKTADAWPPEHEDTRFFLTMDNTLQDHKIPELSKAITFEYDPMRPTPPSIV